MSGRLLAIDPGNEDSAYVLIDWHTRRPIETAKVPNDDLRLVLASHRTSNIPVAIEMIASYGMPVGREVFDTCVWIGRYVEQIGAHRAELVGRQPVKLHHCHSVRATDGNIIQALVDRFTPGLSNKGKGTKAAPGWFHGFSGDIWQAYALAVYYADTRLAPGVRDVCRAGVG